MTQNIGIVGAKEINANGKQKICIDGQWYYGGNTDVSNLNVGQRVDFEWNTFGAQNNLRGLQSWALTPNQPTQAEIDAAKPQERKPWAGKGGGGGFARGQDRGLEIDLQCMRFLGQVVGSAIEAKQIQHPDSLKTWVQGAYEAIKFAKSWGATAPAPAQTATPAGPPKQTPQGSTAQASTTRIRPTGSFGWGQKYKDTPWNLLSMATLLWMRDESGAPAGIKSMCRDEIFFREKDDQAAKALEPQQAPAEPDFDDDIPF